eukprot:m.41055 g.41055  ORF g.41055 m.41055 type:complete len:317 (+) comp33072_c0_seq1:21-971(+)
MDELKLRPDGKAEKEMKEMKDIMQSMWDRLDDLHAKDPVKYDAYIKNVMKENVEQMKPPQIEFTIQTKMIPLDCPLYVNVCSWSVLNTPESDASPLPMRPGCLRHHKWGSVIDVAIHPSVIKRCRNEIDAKDQLVCLLIEYLEKIMDIKLSRESVLESKPKGSYDKKRLQETLQKGFVVEGKAGGTGMIDELSTIVQSSDDAKAMKGDEAVSGKAEAKKPLIQEVRSALSEPTYHLKIKQGDGKRRRRVDIKFELPNVESIKDIQLDISEVDLLLIVPGRYKKVKIILPEKVIKESVSAKFSKTKILTVSIATVKA